MKKLIKATLFLATMLPLTSMAVPEAFVEGVHYHPTSQRLATNSDSKVEVIELFSYSCPHCFSLEPVIMEWKKTLADNVTFVQVPAIFRDSWMQLARVFYAAKASGNLELLHPLLFNAIHVDKRQLKTETQLLDFVAEQGIDRDSFEKMMNSMAVKANVKKALILSQSSGITGVPSIVINGQYRTDAPAAGGMDEMLQTVDFLIDKQ